MLVALLIGLWSSTPALAGEVAPTYQRGAAAKDFEKPEPLLQMRPSRTVELAGRPERTPAERWRTLGFSTTLFVDFAEGYATEWALGNALDFELGRGRLSLRPSLGAIWGATGTQLDTGLAASVRLRADPDDGGPLLGAFSAFRTSRFGPQAVLGPEVGWGEVRVRLGATWTPGRRSQWSQLTPSQTSAVLEISWRAGARLR